MSNTTRGICLMLAGGLIGALASTSLISHAAENPEKLPVQSMRAMAVAFQAIRTQFATAVDDTKILDGCIQGMVENTDPDGRYMRTGHLNADMSAALGLELKVRNGLATIVSTFENSPARRANLQVNDVIRRVDDKDVQTATLPDVVSWLRGAPGSSVKLEISRQGVATPIVVESRREVIRAQTVRSTSLDQGYAYLRIQQFQRGTAEAFLDQVQALQSAGMTKGFVLDLRSNSGGLLNAAVEIASMLLPDSVPISQTNGRTEDSRLTFVAGQPSAITPALKARARKLGLDKLPLVVLVDKGTAAGAEIVAAALMDNQRAKIFGSTTIGRASIQTVISLDNDAAIQLTTAYWTRPSGKTLNGVGVQPDFESFDAPDVEFASRQDATLWRAVAFMKGAS